jgi:outer membrane protein
MRHFVQSQLFFFLIAIFLLHSSKTQAQSRFGYISMTELIQIMPDYKKADSSLNNYQNALSQRYQEMVKEFGEKDSALSAPDTARLTREVLEVKKRALADLYNQIQSYPQQTNQQLQQRQEELLAPIRKKANDLIWLLAKEHGYTYVLLKEVVAVYPSTDDLMPFAKQKLGVK